jgi:hypothetical protein
VWAERDRMIREAQEQMGIPRAWVGGAAAIATFTVMAEWSER